MKLGIVGVGSIGKRHWANAREQGHETRVYDPIAGISDFRFERELYDWCDAAIIATPSQFHEGPLRACVERGKHVLIEKPISVATGGLENLLRAADDKKLTVMMGNNLRFHPVVRRAKLWLTENKVGTPIWANFICATEYSATAMRDGVTLNTGPHEVDVAIHLFGPAEVRCANILSIGDVDVMADFVVLHHATNVRSSFHIDLETPKRVRRFIIGGSEETLYGNMESRITQCGGDFDEAEGSYADDYAAEMRAFVDRIEGHLVPGATGWDGLECLKLLLDIRRKAGLP